MKPADGAVETSPDFDVGPLSWVQGEIGESLMRGLESLAAYGGDPSTPTALQHARSHIHQAAGAIRMVGLDAAVAFTDEIERQLAELETAAPAELANAVAMIDRACRKLRIFLDEIVDGVAPVPLKLYPEFEQMQQARGIKAVTPTDLFYPDLSPRAPRAPPPEDMASRLPSFLVKQRRLFQRGLLGWLRHDEEGSRTMRDAVAGIESVTAQPNLRAFWWTVGALLEAVTSNGLEAGFGLRQLIARIDLQIRRVTEGGAKVADRLRREVLYYVAISAPVGPQVQAVQQAFRLSGLIPSAEVLSADVVQIQPLLREASEQLAGAKDSWLKAAAGRAENLPRLKQTLASVHTKAVEVKHGALMKLTAALVENLDRMPAAGVSEPVAMEFATALLLAESAFDNYASLSRDFPRQVAAMLARLDAARAGRATVASAPMLDEMSRRAQERVLVAQVGREIRANLRHMEQVLDAFFRDNGKRAELASLTRDGQQIRGALQMLGQYDADRLLAMCQEQIERYATTDVAIGSDDLDLLAESLSGLGFFIEALEQQRPDRDRLIAPLIARRQGEAPAVAVVETDSVEHAVAALRAELPALVAQAQSAPADGAAREELKVTLAGLRDDAELIGDADLVAHADAALKAMATGGTAGLAAVVEELADGGVAEAPEISAETQRLLATDTSALDAELLDIYLTEAAEVLDTVGEHHRILSLNPGDRDALATVRRQFHTLKGSGRMVGLADLGELAWEVEQVHNRLIEEDRAVSPSVLAMIDVARDSFRGWVDALRTTSQVVCDPQALLTAIHNVQREWPGGAKLPPPSPVLTRVARPEPAANETFAAQPASATPLDVEMPLDVAVPPDVVVPPDVEMPAAVVEIDVDAPSSVEVVEMELEELAELGQDHAEEAAVVVTDEAPPDEESIDIAPPADADVHAPMLGLVADSDGTMDGDDVTIGEVTLSASLWAILCDEAEQHVGTLQYELSLLQFDARQAPTEAMVRASHTLCGIHRTGGFPPIAQTSKALEQALIALQQRGAPLPSSAQGVLAGAVEFLALCVACVRDRTSFTSADLAVSDRVVRELEELRRDVIGVAALDAETAAEAAADRDELPLAVESRPVEIESQPTASVEVAAPEIAAFIEAIEPEMSLTPAPPEETQGDAASRVPEPEIRLPAPLVDPLAGIRDDVDQQVLAIFIEEASELYPQAGEQVRSWRRNPRDGGVAQQLRRTLHTFKGSARMAGAMRLGELAHLMESRLMNGDTPVSPTGDLFDALDADLDDVACVLDALRDGKVNVTLPRFVPAPPAAAPTPAGEAPAPAQSGAAAAPEAQAAEQDADVAEVEASAKAMLRVRADVIDRLVNESGEVQIARSRVEVELRALKANLLELTASVIRLRSQVREIELDAETQIQSRMSAAQTVHQDFDPLELDRFTRFQELTRSLAEGVNDVSTVQQSLLRNLDDADAALLAQARLSRDVQQRLFAIRTVPFGSLSERLYRILRSTAREIDKRANLELHGGQTELDRSVLEKLVGPLEHLLRNALDHGLETREVRVAAGKPETGEISLTVRQIGNEVVIELADDGSGVDFAGVRRRALSLGMIARDAEPSDQQLIECLFKPGFSTAARVTQISGRGIGMDVVRAEIAALGGRVEVRSKAGVGTQFMLYLPLTLAVAQAVLVRAGGRLWALPAPMVEQVLQIKADALTDLYVSRKAEWKGQSYAFHYLPRLLGDTQHRPETLRTNIVLLLRSGQGGAAIHVDEMVGNQEVVVKNIGPQLARVSGISGATVLGNGEIVLIINPVQLAMRPDLPTAGAGADDERVIAERPGAAARAGTPPAALVMIVDDSLTVRKVTSRMLQREGFEVLTAKDGVDALEQLAEHMPDVILLDIEMPRMDGFEFAKNVKGSPAHANIPIVMITSRTADKHRRRAADLGVDLYIGKPYQEDELLRNLRDMLSLPAPA
ncbi:MAG: Hpt domain-containing protein [Betaproteobacteria bacterium]